MLAHLLWTVLGLGTACPDSLPRGQRDSLAIVRFTADSPAPVPRGATHFAAFRVDSAGLSGILQSWFLVTRQNWEHNYSHVGFGDRTGTAQLRSGHTVRWLVRPGGLAFLEYPDGHRLYLVSCVNDWGREG